MFYSCEENFYFREEKHFFIEVSQVAACIYRKTFLKLRKKKIINVPGRFPGWCPKSLRFTLLTCICQVALSAQTSCWIAGRWFFLSALVKFYLISIIKFIWFFTKPHYIPSIFEKISQKYSSQCDGKKRKEKTAHVWTSWC